METRDRSGAASTGEETPAPEVKHDTVSGEASAEVKQPTVPATSEDALAAVTLTPPEPSVSAGQTHVEPDKVPAPQAYGHGPISLDASSSASNAPTETPQDRPDDTDFIQQPVQEAQLAEEQDLEAEVRHHVVREAHGAADDLRSAFLLTRH